MASDTPTRNRLIYNVYIYLYLAVLNLIFRTICFIMLMVVPIMFSLNILRQKPHKPDAKIDHMVTYATAMASFQLIPKSKSSRFRN